MKLLTLLKNLSLKSKIILLFVIIVLIIIPFLYWVNKTGGIKIGATTVEGQTFSDVPKDFWAYTYIEAVYRARIVGGYPDGTYKPGDQVDRAQMSVFISRAIAGGDDNIPAGPASPSFPDVPVDFWAYKYIEYVKDKGIVGGYPDGTYGPSNIVDRAQLAVYVARAVGGGESGLSDYILPSEPSFPDVPVDFWAYKYIEYCKENAIASGYPDGTYVPNNKITRDQMAVYVVRAFNLIEILIPNISGVVTDNNGNLIVNAIVMFNDPDILAETDSNGNYSLEKVPPGLYEVIIVGSDNSVYEFSNLENHLIPIGYDTEEVNLTGLIKQ